MEVTKKGRSILNSEIDIMEKDIIKIEQMVSMATLKVQRSLTDVDVNLAKEVIDEDENINNLCLELEKRAYKVIALQQPISSDLRYIVSMIRIIPDLERMGDHIKAIAKVVKDLNVLEVTDSVNLICEGLSLLRERLDNTLETFISRDSLEAREIAKGDDDIDEISKQILRHVIKEMKEDVEHIKKVSKLLLLGKSVERIGDYIVNICETTIFLNTGELVELM